MNLLKLRPLVEIMASERTHDMPSLWDDAVQEGLIAAWDASLKRPNAPDVYLHGAARNGVRMAVSGRPFTGSEGRRGWQDAHDYAEHYSAWAESAEVDEDWRDYMADPSAELALHRVEMADIRAAVRAAVSGLDDMSRQIVVNRFWWELTNRQTAERMGSTEASVRLRWNRVIRPHLRDQLEGKVR